jgi:hypothetical protein
VGDATEADTERREQVAAFHPQLSCWGFLFAVFAVRWLAASIVGRMDGHFAFSPHSAFQRISMSEQHKLLDDLVLKLKQQRDELQVRIHLAKAEVRDEWDRLDRRFIQLMDDYKPARDATGQAAANVWAALELAGEEILHGFNQIRKAL